MQYRYYCITLIEQVIQWRSAFWRPEVFYEGDENILLKYHFSKNRIMRNNEIFSSPLAESFFKKCGVIFKNPILLIPYKNSLHISKTQKFI